MMYPFFTLEDGTEIVLSEMKSDGSVKVLINRSVKPTANANKLIKRKKGI